MSLINDALKRASQSQKQPPPAGPLGIPLQPAEPARSSSNNLLVPLLGIGLVLMSGLFLWAWMRGQKDTQATGPATVVATGSPTVPVTTPTPPAPKATTAPTPKPAPTTVAKVDVPPPTVTPKAEPPVTKPAVVEPKPVVVPPPVVETPKPATVVEPPVVTPPVPKPAVVTAPVPKAEFPELKLQGIFYRLTKSSALISGRTVFVGDKVEGARVIAIERMSVTVEFGGERKALSLQ